jgi:hypothetical protein
MQTHAPANSTAFVILDSFASVDGKKIDLRALAWEARLHSAAIANSYSHAAGTLSQSFSAKIGIETGRRTARAILMHKAYSPIGAQHSHPAALEMDEEQHVVSR